LNNAHSFALVRDYVDEIVLVNEEQIAAAIRHLFWNEQLVVEGAGAVGIAALLNDAVSKKGDHIAVVISGRNIDMKTFAQIVAS
jgi:threonine dehydratase